ncbi:MAG: hypothetical protein NZM44_05360, partial [Candidatus Calescibacterium sp.]|nr:hypothetical protein [Candidatus Calescibacterium sp.]
MYNTEYEKGNIEYKTKEIINFSRQIGIKSKKQIKRTNYKKLVLYIIENNLPTSNLFIRQIRRAKVFGNKIDINAMKLIVNLSASSSRTIEKLNDDEFKLVSYAYQTNVLEGIFNDFDNKLVELKNRLGLKNADTKKISKYFLYKVFKIIDYFFTKTDI